MTDVQVQDQPTADAARNGTPDMKLEVVVLPVSDVDRSLAFYKGLGWRVDAEFADGEGFRVAQLTPPGSQASVIFGAGVTSAEPGSVDALQLTVADIDAAREDLVDHGIDVSEVFHDAGGVFHHAGTDARVDGPAEDHADYGSFLSFSDPDGNAWVLQEVRTPLPGRVTNATFNSAAELEDSLKRAAAAHGEHEKRTGEYDAQWPTWYATHMFNERTGEELPL